MLSSIIITPAPPLSYYIIYPPHPPRLLSFPKISAQPAAALHGAKPSAYRLQWDLTATVNAAALRNTGAKMRIKVEAPELAVAWTIIFPSRQTIRARSAIWELATNPHSVPQGLIAQIAAPAVVRLLVPAGIGILPVAHLAAANRGATRAPILRLGAKTWG